MARTARGNLIGRAAQSEHIDLQNKIIEERHAYTMRVTKAMEQLKELDPGWNKWFDERPEQTVGEMLPLIEQRIANFQKAKEQ